MGGTDYKVANVYQDEDCSAYVMIGKYHIEGFTSSFGVSNYLGIPYAEIPARFQQARLIDPLKLQGVHDGRRYGPRCPQPIDVARVWRQHLYEGVQQSDSLPMSEFGCLNLNVYTPVERSIQPLPVFVWIHGGGFVVGDGGPEYDGNFLVHNSVKLGKPFIYVAFNYRLGYCGFLASEQLKEEALAAGEVPYSNVGLLDQRLALQWVQKNIQYFGGDGSNITIAGESAGAWSVLAHLRSNVPVCQRAVVMSAPSLAPRDAASAQRDFDRLVVAAGIDAQAPDSEKLIHLRCMTSNELLNLAPKAIVLPSWDPEWFSHQDQLNPLERVGTFPSWLEGIVIGWTANECALFGFVGGWTNWSIENIHSPIQQAIPDASFADEVMHAYGINSTLQDTAIKGLIRFASEGMFENLIHSFKDYPSPPMSIYRFDQVDSCEHSPFYGYAYHALDNVFTCRLPAVAGDLAPAEWRATADVQSRSFTDFVYGSQPWETYNSSERIQSFNGTKSGLVEWTGLQRWAALASTSEKEKMLRQAVRVLMSLSS